MFQEVQKGLMELFDIPGGDHIAAQSQDVGRQYVSDGNRSRNGDAPDLLHYFWDLFPGNRRGKTARFLILTIVT